MSSKAYENRYHEKVGFSKRSKSKGKQHREQGHEVLIDCKYDSIFCKTCDEWVEPECSCDPLECPFPKPRPDKPSNCFIDENDLPPLGLEDDECL